MDATEGTVTWKAASVARSSMSEMGSSGESGFGINWKDLLEETRRIVGLSWNCSHVEDDLEEGDAMDWLKDDEVMRQWRQVSNEELLKAVRRNEGRKNAEGVQNVLELMVSQAQMKNEAKKEKDEGGRLVHRKKKDRSKRESKTRKK